MTGLLDRALEVAIARAGTPIGVRYTERQLFYELCRVLHPLHAAPRRPPFTLAPPIRYRRFRAALHRRSHVPGLLAEPDDDGHRGGAPVATEPDLYDYGLPRLLICQHRSVAAMLLANDFHLESACPVFTAADLPLDPRIVDGLGRAEGAAVYVLHDASLPGMRAFHRVREQLEPPTGVRLDSLGLRPQQAATLHLTAGRGPTHLDGELPEALDPWERDWLHDGRFAEIAAIRPARLLRTVHRLVRDHRRVRRDLPWLREELRRARGTGFMSWPAC